jgi:hypothetical protein
VGRLLGFWAAHKKEKKEKKQAGLGWEEGNG